MCFIAIAIISFALVSCGGSGSSKDKTSVENLINYDDTIDELEYAVTEFISLSEKSTAGDMEALKKLSDGKLAIEIGMWEMELIEAMREGKLTEAQKAKVEDLNVQISKIIGRASHDE